MSALNRPDLPPEAAEQLTPGTPVRSGDLRGVVLDPAEATMPPRGDKCVYVRWRFDGFPSWSTAWERASDLESDDGR